MNQTKPEFQIGVNYWPARSAMRMWKEFDSGEVREDFARMAEFKLSPVRIFLLWEDFQPEPFKVSNKALNRLVEFCSHAGDYGAGVWVTLFTGHVSGANWLPSWMLSPDAEETFFPVITGSTVVEKSATGVTNPYGNTDLRRAQKKQIREVLSALKGHPALRCWDLGDAVSNVFRPVNPDEGRSWMKEMTEEIKLQDDENPVTFGLLPQDLEETRGIGPAEVAQCCDLLSINTFSTNPERTGEKLNALFPLFLAEISSWLAGGKPAWISGVGASTGKDPLSFTEQQAAIYAESSIAAMKRHGLPGALWWCYSDYVNRFWENAPFDINPHEMSCGVFRSDGAPKETAVMLAETDRKPGNSEMPRDWIDIGPEEYRLDPRGQMRRLFSRFLELSP